MISASIAYEIAEKRPWSRTADAEETQVGNKYHVPRRLRSLHSRGRRGVKMAGLATVRKLRSGADAAEGAVSHPRRDAGQSIALLQCLAMLDAVSVARAAQVCKAWAAVAARKELWHCLFARSFSKSHKTGFSAEHAEAHGKTPPQPAVELRAPRCHARKLGVEMRAKDLLFPVAVSGIPKWCTPPLPLTRTHVLFRLEDAVRAQFQRPPGRIPVAATGN